MKLDVLAIGAHPDDIELSCSATVAKLTASGAAVGVLDLTEGELGTRGDKKIRAAEAEQASKILGLTARLNLQIPDGGIVVTPKNIEKVIQVIRYYTPKILLIPHSLERHPDHEHTHTIAKEAWFYSGLEKIKTRYNGKFQHPHRPARYFQFMQKFEFVPNLIIDVSTHYHKKKESLSAFGSQFYDPNSKERETLLSSKHFLESVFARDRHFGSLINVEYGEPFLSVEPVGIHSFFDLVLA